MNAAPGTPPSHPGPSAAPGDVTRILLDAPTAPRHSAEALLPLVYAQLRAAAQQELSRERTGHTLQATALVHEAYLKLVGPRDLPWQNRAHFYAAASEAMRRILIDHARARAAASRGGPDARKAAISLTTLPDLSSETQSAGFLILDEAITRLSEVDPQAASVVHLRYFAGMSIDQTAAALDLSPATVKRAWPFARAWLRESIEAGRI